MIKIGDKVKFLNDVGEGTVTGFIGKNMVNVEDADGFGVPTLVSDLLVVNSDERYDGTKKTGVEKTSQPEIAVSVESKETAAREDVPERDDPAFFMVFVPDQPSNPVGGPLDTFLVNDSNYKLLYQFAHFDGVNYETVASGILSPNSKLLLESFSPSDISSLPEFYFQLIYFKEKANKLNPPVVKEISVNPVRFYKEKTFTQTPYSKKPALAFSLLNRINDSLDQITEKEFKELVRKKQKDIAVNEPEKPKRVRTPDLVEVDLHINELIDDIRGLSNTEMLKIQMDRFLQEMDDAIKNQVKKIIFIHGVGNGTLKQEVRRELSSRYRKYSFQDASFQEYGYGATMVILHK